MSRQSAPQPKRSKLPIIGCSLGAFVIAVAGVCIVMGVAGYLYFRNRELVSLLAVQIVSPENGGFAQLNQQVIVRASATNPTGVYRLELYADGALVAAQDTQLKGGENPLALTGFWTPVTAGRHILVARGYHKETEFADSPAVSVEAEAGTTTLDANELAQEDGTLPSLNDISTLICIPVDQLIAANPSLSGTDPAAPLPEGTHLEVPHPSPGCAGIPGTSPGPGTGPGPGPGPSSPPIPIPPPPPGRPTPPTIVSVTATSCTSALITWGDVPDEDHYHVFRLVGATLTRITTSPLPINTTTYSDTLPASGTYTYQVAALRAGHQSLSLMANVTTPATCPPPGPPVIPLLLTLADLHTDDVYQGVFCYASVNSRALDRIPSNMSTMLTREPSNPKFYTLNRLPDRGRYILTGQPTVTPVTFYAECWGVNLPMSERLGSFTVIHPNSDWNSEIRTANGGRFSLRYCLGPTTGVCGRPTGGVEPVEPPTITSMTLPSPEFLRIEDSTVACSELPTPLLQWGCRVSRVPTLMWDWTGNATYNESMLTHYQVVMTTTNVITGATTSQEWDISRRAGALPRGTLPRHSASTCGVRYSYTVAAAIDTTHSVPSVAGVYNTPPCISSVALRVIFVEAQMDLGCDISGFCPTCPCDPEFEIYGSWSGGAGTGTFLKRFNGSDPYVCAHPDYMEMTAARYRGNNFLLSDQIPDGRCENQHVRRNNNILDLTITDPRQSVGWGFLLLDNKIFIDEVVCYVYGALRPHTLAEWAHLDVPITLSGHSSEGDCTVIFQVSGAPSGP